MDRGKTRFLFEPMLVPEMCLSTTRKQVSAVSHFCLRVKCSESERSKVFKQSSVLVVARRLRRRTQRRV